VDWQLGRRVSTERGEIAYEVMGDGPPVILTHGTPSRSVVWREVAPVLARDHQVFVWDLLGFGESERHVDQDVGLAAQGEVLAELSERWDVDRPTLVGHDIGGAVVLRAHLLEDVRASRLALIDAVVLAPWITPRTRQMQREIDRWSSLPDPELAELIAEHLRTATARPLRPEVFAALFSQWEGEQGQALYLRNLAQLDEDHTRAFEPRLSSVDVPTLLVWGEEDAWLPVEVSERIRGLVPGAQRLVIPQAGHFCMEDQPQAVASALGRFCAGPSRAG
jgi:pimeloyl-ACP methyl ester carboxylesterase